MRKGTSSTRTSSRDEEAARKRCLRLLSLRARSAAELRERLIKADFDEGTIAAVLGDLERVGLVDDEDLARTWVADRHTAGRCGRRKLRSELRRKGIADEVIRRVVDSQISDDAELRQAMRVARQRLQDQPAREADVRRLTRFLLGRGFEPETVDAVVSSVVRDWDQ
jgi:regulatory protein